MKEITFIKRNKQRWESFEKAVSQSDNRPDELADQYIQLTDDLSYAKTFYPNTPTSQYLNSLTINTHQQIYKNKKEKSGRFKQFWIKELPLELYSARKYFFISFLVFLIAATIGVVSALNEDGFLRLILGDAYVNQTIENIEKGDPMGIYNSSNEFVMFLQITFNNIKVSFIAFVFGILTPVAVGFVLFQNGVMLGAFQTFFYKKGLFALSSLAIYIHGALEIPAIVLAGGAGMVLGNSFVFPKTLPRVVSLGQGMRKGLKMLVGLVPLFFMAGFLESFITRHYQTLPLAINLLIIGGSFALIIWYFFIYPVHIYKKEEKTQNYSHDGSEY